MSGGGGAKRQQSWPQCYTNEIIPLPGRNLLGDLPHETAIGSSGAPVMFERESVLSRLKKCVCSLRIPCQEGCVCGYGRVHI